MTQFKRRLIDLYGDIYAWLYFALIDLRWLLRDLLSLLNAMLHNRRCLYKDCERYATRTWVFGDDEEIAFCRLHDLIARNTSTITLKGNMDLKW